MKERKTGKKNQGQRLSVSLLREIINAAYLFVDVKLAFIVKRSNHVNMAIVAFKCITTCFFCLFCLLFTTPLFIFNPKHMDTFCKKMKCLNWCWLCALCVLACRRIMFSRQRCDLWWVFAAQFPLCVVHTGGKRAGCACIKPQRVGRRHMGNCCLFRLRQAITTKKSQYFVGCLYSSIFCQHSVRIWV